MAERLPRDFGPYFLERLISGEGGQGTVYLTLHKVLDRRVVIKLLREHLAQHDSFVERFAAEASQLAKLDHANIVRVRQSGPLDGQFFIEMEHVEGWDLSAWIKAQGALPAEIAALLGMKASADLLARYVADPAGTVRGLQQRGRRRALRPYVSVVSMLAVLAVVAVVAAAVLPVLLRSNGAPPAQPPSADPGAAVTGAQVPAVVEVLAPPETLAFAAPPPPVDSSRVAAKPVASAAGTPPTPVPGSEPAATVTPVAPSVTLPAAPGALSMAWSTDSIVVEVTVTASSDIYLDDNPVASGVTHWIQRVLRKRWKVRVDGGDYGTREQKRSPRPQDTLLAFNIDLTSGAGGVNVTGPRGGLDIDMDGIYQHVVTPSPVRPVAVGAHLIELRDRRTGGVVASWSRRAPAISGSISPPAAEFRAGPPFTLLHTARSCSSEATRHV